MAGFGVDVPYCNSPECAHPAQACSMAYIPHALPSNSVFFCLDLLSPPLHLPGNMAAIMEVADDLSKSFQKFEPAPRRGEPEVRMRAVFPDRSEHT